MKSPIVALCSLVPREASISDDSGSTKKQLASPDAGGVLSNEDSSEALPLPSSEDSPASEAGGPARIDEEAARTPLPDAQAPWLRDPELGVAWKDSWAADQPTKPVSKYEPRSLEQLFQAAHSREIAPEPERRLQTDEFLAWRGPSAAPTLPWEVEARSSWLGPLLGIGLVAGAVIGLSAWAMGPGAKNVEVRRYRVPVQSLPADLEGLRIAQVSDLLVPGGATGVASAAAILAREPADIVVLTGDLLDGKGPASLAALQDVLGPFRGRKATIAVAGEHDLQAGVTVEQLRDALRAQGVTLLSDERLPVKIGRASVTFIGLGHPSDPDRLEASTIGARRGVEIWAAHAPNLLAAVPPKGFERAAFALAGHTRGGQLRFPFTDGFPPEGTAPFVEGWYTVRGRLVYVNRGLGTSGVPARLMSPPEVTVLTLRRALVDGEVPLPDAPPAP